MSDAVALVAGNGKWSMQAKWVCVFAAFLRMLCAMKWGIYVFFGVWQFMAILFTYFLVPETRGLAIEEVGYFLCCTGT